MDATIQNLQILMRVTHIRHLSLNNVEQQMLCDFPCHTCDFCRSTLSLNISLIWATSRTNGGLWLVSYSVYAASAVFTMETMWTKYDFRPNNVW